MQLVSIEIFDDRYHKIDFVQFIHSFLCVLFSRITTNCIRRFFCLRYQSGLEGMIYNRFSEWNIFFRCRNFISWGMSFHLNIFCVKLFFVGTNFADSFLIENLVRIGLSDAFGCRFNGKKLRVLLRWKYTQFQSYLQDSLMKLKGKSFFRSFRLKVHYQPFKQFEVRARIGSEWHW